MKMNWIPRLNLAARLAAKLRGPADHRSNRPRTTSGREPVAPPTWGYVALSAVLGSAMTVGSASGQGTAVQHNGEQFRVVQASDSGGMINFPSMSSLIGNEEIAQVGLLDGPRQSRGCNSCGTASCGGQCGGSSYGGSSYGGFGGPGSVNSSTGYTSGAYGECPKCVPYRYGIVEALYMRREGLDDRSLSEQFRLDEPDFEFAPRITIGVVPDCVNGLEASFVGPFSWDTQDSRTLVDGLVPRLNLSTVAPLNPAIDLFAFGLDNNPNDAIFVSGADFQSQRYEADYWSFEASRTMIAWDVAKFMIGGRYIDYSEEYQFASQNSRGTAANGDVGRGLINSETANRLIGLQLGLDVYNPIGRFSSTYFRGRAGAYLNLAETDFSAVTSTQSTVGGVAAAAVDRTILNREDSTSELAGVIELGAGVRYQVGEILALRFGTELWYMSGIASATDQFDTVFDASLGDGISVDDDILFVGFTAGAELKF